MMPHSACQQSSQVIFFSSKVQYKLWTMQIHTPISPIMYGIRSYLLSTRRCGRIDDNEWSWSYRQIKSLVQEKRCLFTKTLWLTIKKRIILPCCDVNKRRIGPYTFTYVGFLSDDFWITFIQNMLFLVGLTLSMFRAHLIFWFTYPADMLHVPSLMLLLSIWTVKTSIKVVTISYDHIHHTNLGSIWYRWRNGV